eukprot:GDKI01023460.1.p1 GENE.GDKI01023460.1~~GDKI01023460.1.p1  ORF type:complete len:174 (+),score=59.48 GDKI01023460.1:64-522(+)
MCVYVCVCNHKFPDWAFVRPNLGCFCVVRIVQQAPACLFWLPGLTGVYMCVKVTCGAYWSMCVCVCVILCVRAQRVICWSRMLVVFGTHTHTLHTTYIPHTPFVLTCSHHTDHIHTYIRTHAHTHTHIRTQTYTHAHTHTRTHAEAGKQGIE